MKAKKIEKRLAEISPKLYLVTSVFNEDKPFQICYKDNIVIYDFSIKMFGSIMVVDELEDDEMFLELQALINDYWGIGHIKAIKKGKSKKSKKGDASINNEQTRL